MVSSAIASGAAASGRRRASSVALVAVLLLGEHLPASRPVWRRAGARAPAASAVRKTFSSASGGDDRADVAALRDPVAGGDQRALLLDQRRAHGRVGGDLRRGLGDLGRADRLGDVLAVEQ